MFKLEENSKEIGDTTITQELLNSAVTPNST
jgi:hypothetical protein